MMQCGNARVQNVFCRYDETPCSDILQIAQLASLAALDTNALVAEVFHDQKSESFIVQFTNSGGDFETRFRLYYEDLYGVGVETAGDWQGTDSGWGGVWCGLLLERRGGW